MCNTSRGVGGGGGGRWYISGGEPSTPGPPGTNGPKEKPPLRTILVPLQGLQMPGSPPLPPPPPPPFPLHGCMMRSFHIVPTHTQEHTLPPTEHTKGHCGLGPSSHVCGHAGEHSLISLPGRHQGEPRAVAGGRVGGRGSVGHRVRAPCPRDEGGGAATPHTLQICPVTFSDGDGELNCLYRWKD